VGYVVRLFSPQRAGAVENLFTKRSSAAVRRADFEVYAKAEPGRFRTSNKHIPHEKVSPVERGTDALLRQTASIGPHTKAWSEAMTEARGIEAVRVLVGRTSLAGKHTTEALELACQMAFAYLDNSSYVRCGFATLPSPAAERGHIGVSGRCNFEEAPKLPKPGRPKPRN